ncbi:MAG TPA: DISARM system phospholipase D-like protein DrmC [Phycisphaerae bacterium]|nr:DISARM system phospholipase D-like protein DrmC [Phycisphaerae bacterium]
MLEPFQRLSPTALRELATCLREGSMASGATSHALQQIVGAPAASRLLPALGSLAQRGWSPGQIATLAEAIANAKSLAASPENQVDLVLSGPEIPGVPTRDTAAVMHSLVEQAINEVLLVGYAVHRCRGLFERLAQKMAAQPGLKVWFCLNIERKPLDTSLSSEIARRFALNFVQEHWPWDPKPDVYYDPRSLQEERAGRTSLHAKCLVIDSSQALITSANFTEAAQTRNIEAGVIVGYKPLVERLAGYFDALRQSGLLVQCDLP